MRRLTIILLAAITCMSCKKSEDVKEFIPEANHQKQVVVAERSAKRGVGFNFDNTADVMNLYGSTSWCYNWGPDEDADTDEALSLMKMEFIPMAWTKNFSEERITAWKMSHPTCQYILGFNEPNLKDQCNMTPAEVAAEWPRLKALADALNMQLVSPAMNYGTLPGYSDPIKWLDEFFRYIPIEESGITAIAVHCYMNACSAVEGYLERFEKYGLPIWLTEFCAWDGGVSGHDAQADYMAQTINMLERNTHVARYAWFMPRMSTPIDASPYNQLLTHEVASELTPLGRLFAGLPNYSKPTLQAAELKWSLNLFTNLEHVPAIRQSTDPEMADCGWMYENIIAPQWMEFQIEAIKDLQTLEIRYQSDGMPIISVSIDGAKDRWIIMKETTGWSTFAEQIPLARGKHTVRVSVQQGFLDLSWLRWQ